MFTDDKLLQPMKAELPMEVTLLGIVTEVSFVQFRKALSAIFATVYSSPSYITVEGMMTSPL